MTSGALSFILKVHIVLFLLRLKCLAFLNYLKYWHTSSFAQSGNWHRSVSILEADFKCMRILFTAFWDDHQVPSWLRVWALQPAC